MTAQHLQLLVAGHTNTGKTAMLRTLGRRSEFGEVSPRSGATRQIEQINLVDTPTFQIAAYDSPGFERAPELRDQAEEKLSGRRDRHTALQEILSEPSRRETFAFETVILEQALRCDAILYIIDAREPVLEKYLDEIFLLGLCGKPLICLLNFTAGDSRETDWRAHLAATGQHLIVSFDAVVYSWQSEASLYSALQNVLPAHSEAISWLYMERQQNNDWRLRGAALALSEALVEIAAAEDIVDKNDQQALTDAQSRLRDYVRRRETETTQQILAAFNYAPAIHGSALHADFSEDGWQRDPFNADTMRFYGLELAKGSAGGAGIGMAVDIMTAGLTLGLPTLVGLITGSMVGAQRLLRHFYLQKVRHATLVAVNDDVLRLIATRNLQLIARLESRGHGDTRVDSVDDHQTLAFNGKIPTPLLVARDHPRWSAYRPQSNYQQYFTDLKSWRLPRLLYHRAKQLIDDSLHDNNDEKQKNINKLLTMIHTELEPFEKLHEISSQPSRKDID